MLEWFGFLNTDRNVLSSLKVIQGHVIKDKSAEVQEHYSERRQLYEIS